jgi:hypothetical protein
MAAIRQAQAEAVVNSQAREDLWNALLDAEMNEIYWSHEAQRHGSRDRFFAATAAIVSSGTVLALFASYPNIGKGVALLSSVVSIIHALLPHRKAKTSIKFGGKMERISD